MAAVRFRNGSSFISAMDWDISSKFDMQIDLHLLKRVQSRNVNPEVDFRLYSRHLEKSIWRNNFAVDSPNTTKFGMQMQKDMPMIAKVIVEIGSTGWAKKVDQFWKYVTPVYYDVGRRLIYQNVQHFIRSKTDILSVATVSYTHLTLPTKRIV